MKANFSLEHHPYLQNPQTKKCMEAMSLNSFENLSKTGDATYLTMGVSILTLLSIYVV